MSEYRLDVNQIQNYLPHRAPFLLIDRILDIESKEKEGTKVTAIKNITFNEPYLQGHFPGFAIMPGVLILEAMAQTAGFSLYPEAKNNLEAFRNGFKLILVGVNQARFRKPVVPGDTLQLETVVKKVRGKLWIFDCVGKVGDEKVAEAEIMANLIPSGELS